MELDSRRHLLRATRPGRAAEGRRKRRPAWRGGCARRQFATSGWRAGCAARKRAERPKRLPERPRRRYSSIMIRTLAASTPAASAMRRACRGNFHFQHVVAFGIRLGARRGAQTDHRRDAGQLLFGHIERARQRASRLVRRGTVVPFSPRPDARLAETRRPGESREAQSARLTQPPQPRAAVSSASASAWPGRRDRNRRGAVAQPRRAERRARERLTEAAAKEPFALPNDRGDDIARLGQGDVHPAPSSDRAAVSISTPLTDRLWTMTSVPWPGATAPATARLRRRRSARCCPSPAGAQPSFRE